MPMIDSGTSRNLSDELITALARGRTDCGTCHGLGFHFRDKPHPWPKERALGRPDPANSEIATCVHCENPPVVHDMLGDDVMAFWEAVRKQAEPAAVEAEELATDPVRVPDGVDTYDALPDRAGPPTPRGTVIISAAGVATRRDDARSKAWKKNQGVVAQGAGEIVPGPGDCVVTSTDGLQPLTTHLAPRTEPEHVAQDGTVRKSHYGAGRQPWDDIREWGWAPHFAAGNVLKYVRRAAAKNGEDDLKKARWYWAELRKMAGGGNDLAIGCVTKLMIALSDVELKLLVIG